MGTPAPRHGSAGDSTHTPARSGFAEDVFLSDRRHGTRRSLIGGKLVTVRLAGEASGLALDLSETGMGLRAFPDLRIGSTTTLMFELPETNARVEAKGVVAWVERNGSLWTRGSGGRAGVRFVNLSDASRSLLTRWLAAEPMTEGRATAAAPAMAERLDPGDPVSEIRRHLQGAHLAGPAALQSIVERVLAVTQATGAAVALDGGGGMICRATSGNAPEVGVRVQSESGLSGECVRTGQIVRCDDTESDPRVDRDLCHQLGLRSVIVLPLFVGQRLCGVLEAFSSRARAFDSPEVLLLRRVSGLVVEIAASMLGAGAAVHAATPAPALPLKAPPFPPRAQDSQPAPAPAPAGKNRPRRSVKAASLAQTIVCDVCGHENSRGRRICMRCDVPLSVVENYLNVPTAEEARAADAVALMARHTAFTAQEPEAEADHGARLRPPRLRLLIAAALLLAAASLAIGLWKGRQWQRGSNDALSLSPPPALALPPPPMVLAVKPTATAPEIRRAAKPQEPALTARPAVLKERDEAESVQWVAKAAMKPVPTVQPVEPASLPVTTTDLPRLPQTIVIPEGPTAKRDAVEVSRVSGGKLVHKVSPVYPSMAKVTGRTGTVKLTALITRNGKLANLRVQAGDALLANAAIQAVMHWRYEPYRLNGKPIEVETTITVNFGRE